MNTYGTTARRHWARWLPGRYATIENKDSFFSSLGEEAAAQIADLALELAGDDPPGEGYLDKAGRLSMARMQAEEIVLRDLILLPPEPGADPEPDQQEDFPAGPRSLPDRVSRDHPMWAEVNAEQEELAAG